MGAGAGGAEFLLRIREIIDADEASASAAAETIEQIYTRSAQELSAKLQATATAGTGAQAAGIAGEAAAIQRQIQALIGLSRGTETRFTRSAGREAIAAFPGIKGDREAQQALQQAVRSPGVTDMLARADQAFGAMAVDAERLALDLKAQGQLSKRQLLASEGRLAATQLVEQAELEAATLAQQIAQGYAVRAAELRRLNALLEAEIAAEQLDNGFVVAETRRRVATERLAAALEEQAVQERLGTRRAETEIQRTRLRAQEAARLAAPDATGAYVEEQRAIVQRNLARQRALLADNEYIKATAEEILVKKQRSAVEQQLVVSDAAYREAVAIETANRLKVAAVKAQEAAAFAATPQGIALAAEKARAEVELKGVGQAQRKLQLEAQRVVELQTLLGLDRAEITQTAQSVEDAIRLNRLGDQLIAVREQKIRLEALATQRGIIPPARGGGGGTTTGAGSGGTGGLGLAQGFRTTARYGIASFALFGLASGAAEAVREATELDRILNQVERQFRSQFAPSVELATQQFAAFKREVFETAKLTGQAADEVANVGFQLQGAFEGDTARAIAETRDAIIAARVTGLDVREVIDSFTALTKSYEDQDLGIQNVSDAALQLQEDLGVLAKETITFAADLAPLGAQLGFSAEKLAAIGAVAQQTSGRSGTALAEAFGRVLPQIQENAVGIIQTFETLGPTVRENFIEAFAANDIDKVFDLILQNFTALSDASEGEFLDLLGGRREAQSIIGVLRNGEKVFTEYSKAQDAAGKTTEYFNDLQDTLQQRLARLGEEFRHLVQGLFESGLKEFFVDFLDILSVTVKLLETIFSLLGGIGSGLGPLAGPLGTVLQSALLLRGGLALGRLGGGIGGKLFGAGGVSTGRGFLGRASEFAVPSGAVAGAFGTTAGATTARSLGQGLRGALPTLAGLGFGVGALYMTKLDADVREGAEARARELTSKVQGGGLDLNEEIDRLLGRANAPYSADDIRRQLRSGRSIEEVTTILADRVKNDASFYEQYLDILPLELSKKISVPQAELDALTRLLADGINSELDQALTNLGDDEDLLGDTKDRVAEIFDRLLDTDAYRADLRTLVAQRVNDAIADERGVIPSESGDLITAIVNALTSDAEITIESFRQRLPERLQESFTSLERSLGGTSALGSTVAGFFDFDINNLLDAVAGDIQGAAKLRDRINEALESEDIRTAFRALETDIQEGNLELDPRLDQVLPQIRDFVLGALDTLEAQQEVAEEALLSLDEAIKGRELGTVSEAEVVRIRDESITLFTRLGDEAKALELVIDAREDIVRRIEEQLDAYAGLNDLLGGGEGIAPSLQLISSQLDDPDSELSIEQEADLARRYVEQLRERRAGTAALIEDDLERARFLASEIQIDDPQITEALLADAISASQGFVDALDRAFEGDQQKIDEAIRNIAAVAVATGEGLVAAAEDVLDLQIYTAERIEKLRAAIGNMYANLDKRVREAAQYHAAIGLERDVRLGITVPELDELAVLDDLATGSITGSSGEDPAELQRRAEEEARREAERRRREELEAAGEYARALEELREARGDLVRAQIETDPLKLAQAEAFIAGVAIGEAETEAERLRAQAAKIRADRALRDAMFDIQQSQVELLIAMADAAGDTVEVAELQIRAIQEQIARARQEGVGQAELNQLQGQLIQAEAGLRDATLADRREYYQYLADVGKITQGQLINYLQSLLAIPDLTEKQIRDIQREIYNLRQQLGQDFQFNLPANLQLPTLYEVRRLDQSSVGGGGYNDNRTISVVVNAETNASAEDIADAVVNVMGDPTRSGTVTRRY